jgi:hypothetical protein
MFEAEILDADGQTRTASIVQNGTLFEQVVPFSAIQSVAIYQGREVLEAFGRPPANNVPEWAEYAEVSV